MSSTLDQASPPASERVSGAFFRPAGDLSDAWRDFLVQFPWEWFCTLTFRDEIHPEAASKAFRYWVALINKDIFGNNWRRARRARGGLHWVCALEWQKRGVLHFHALVGGDRSVTGYAEDSLYVADRQHWSREWDRIAGFAKLDLIDDQAHAVHGYVSKYVAKGGQIDLSPNVEVRCSFQGESRAA